MLRAPRATEPVERSATAADPASDSLVPRVSPVALPVHRLDGSARARLAAVRDAQALIEAGVAKARAVAEAAGAHSVGQSTLYRWLAVHDERGVAGLCRKRRADGGQHQTTISRAWAKLAAGLGLDASAMAAIESRLAGAARDEWAAGVASAAKVRHNLRPRLLKWTREAANVQSLPPTSRRACLPPAYFVKRYEAHRKEAIRRHDAGQWAAKHTPRIQRCRRDLRPMQWVAADVHHVDVLMHRADGSAVYPKVIAWQDLATNRLYMTAHLLPRGQAVRESHVIDSYKAMCADPAWGVPETIYGDNGREYNWLDMAGDLAALVSAARPGGVVLAAPTDEVRTLVRSLPYNPQGKVIEGPFGSFTQWIFSQLPGHVGGDRLKKKTANQGREPAPFPGTEAAFREALAVSLDYYHALPQSGHLDGTSPAERLAEFAAEGWQSVVLEPAHLDVVFASEVTRLADRGRVSVDGAQWYADALLSLTGEKVWLRIPKAGDGSRIYAFDGPAPTGRFLAVLAPEILYPFASREGARETRRRNRELMRQHREREALAPGQRRDPLSVMREVAELAPKAAVTPLATAGVSEQYTRAAEAEAPEPAPARPPRRDKELEMLELFASMSRTGTAQ